MNIRAWDHKEKKYHYLGEDKTIHFYFTETGIQAEQFYKNITYTSEGDSSIDTYSRMLDHLIYERHLSLVDRKGNPIYEGSIVHISSTKRILGKSHKCNSEVKRISGLPYVWPHPIVDGKLIRYGAKLLNSGSAGMQLHAGVATKEVEVIGNIHENPELLFTNEKEYEGVFEVK